MPTAYTPATTNPVTMYAARIMWVASYGVEALKNTDTGSTLLILPLVSVYPAGEFIHEFAAPTEIAPRIPDTTIGIPVHQCAHGDSRRHPYRYTPTKMASRKKKIPSTENGKPIAAPNRPIRPGHSRPISYDSTVPDTAPTATSTAMTFDQRRASSSAAASPRLMPIHSAVMVTAANAMPKHARMMWNPSDDPICDRAGTGSAARTYATAPIVRLRRLHATMAQQSRPPMCTATALRVGRGGYPRRSPRG